MERSRLLIVDDVPEVADTYARQLAERYDVVVAYGGDEALERIDASVDAVLLDRQMPDRSGVEVIDAIHDRGFDPMVALATAVDPDVTVADVPFDGYLVKPFSREELHETIERMLAARSAGTIERQLFAVRSRRDFLRRTLPREHLEDNDTFARLEADVRELQERLETAEDDTPASAERETHSTDAHRSEGRR